MENEARPAQRLIFHRQNGACSLRTFDEKGNETASELVARFVYADAAMQERLVETVRATLVERGHRLLP
jgi:hypothetical protein